MALNFPDSPSNGDTTTLNGVSYTYDSTKTVWVSTTGPITTVAVSDNAPATPTDGDMWFNSSDLKLYIRYNDGATSQWIIAAPAGPAGADSTVAGPSGGDGRAGVYADMAALIAKTGMVAGDTALVTALNKVFMYTGSAWFLIATMANASPSAITGVNSTYGLAIDGTATTITAISTDPEGFPLTWSYAVTTGSLGSTATVSQADNVFTITPSSTPADAGTFSITFSVTDGSTGAVNAVSAFSLSFGPDMSAASYDNLSFYFGSQESRAQVVRFNSDGTKMFSIGHGSDAVHQFSLTTGFSLASGNVTYDNLSFSVSSQTTIPTSMVFNSDGTKMFVVDYYGAVFQYSLTTGFSLASGNVSYDNLSFDTTSQEGTPRDMAFNSDGTKMFLIGSDIDAVFQYSLTNGFSLASGNVSYDNINFSVATYDNDPVSLAFNADGTKMFYLGGINAGVGKVYQFSLTNGFSLASGNVSYDNINFSVADNTDTGNDTYNMYAQGLSFSADGTKMFVVGDFNNYVYQYSVS